MMISVLHLHFKLCIINVTSNQTERNFVMKIGICGSAQRALQGYPTQADFVEINAIQIHRMTDEVFAKLCKDVKEVGLPLYSCNCLIDGNLRLTGPEVDFDAIDAYCDRLFERLDALNIHTLVFGSGKAKHVPEGFPMEKAWDQLYKLGALLATKAAPHGHTIVVEPLSYNEVNIVNTMKEGAHYVKTINHDSFKLLVDFYHFDNNGEAFEDLPKYADLLKHAHFASAKERTVPKTEEDWAFFAKCVKSLKQIGYTGALSFEGSSTPEELPDMLMRMKEIEHSIL